MATEPDHFFRFLAALGVVLSIVSIWLTIRKSAVRIKVVPHVSLVAGSTNAYLEAIEVINNSEFPIGVAEVGVMMKEGDEIACHSRLDPALLIDQRSGQRLRVTPLIATMSTTGNIKYCYVRTTQGRIFKADRRLLTLGKRDTVRQP